MASKPTNLGLVGLSAGGSWLSRAHLPFLKNTPDYKIVALQNSSKASAEKSRNTYDLSQNISCYGDIQALVDDKNVDLVVVSVKVPHHYELIKPPLEAKKDVFSEWPLAANLKEAEELTTLAKQQGVKTVVGLQARQDPSVRKAKEMVANGELGDILGTTMFGHGFVFGPTATPDYVYLFPLENGANLLTIPFGHAVDALCWVVGEFSDLQATLKNTRPKLKVNEEMKEKSSHDQIAVQGTLANGGGVASVVYQGGSSQTGKNFYWEISGTKGTLVLEAPMGNVQMFHPTLSFVKAEDGAVLGEVKVDWEKREDFSLNVETAWNALLGKGDGSVTTFEDALLRHKMIDAIYRSNDSGQRERYL